MRDGIIDWTKLRGMRVTRPVLGSDRIVAQGYFQQEGTGSWLYFEESESGLVVGTNIKAPDMMGLLFFQGKIERLWDEPQKPFSASFGLGETP